jgi:hypothetical protein
LIWLAEKPLSASGGSAGGPISSSVAATSRSSPQAQQLASSAASPIELARHSCAFNPRPDAILPASGKAAPGKFGVFLKTAPGSATAKCAGWPAFGNSIMSKRTAASRSPSVSLSGIAASTGSILPRNL